MPCFLRLVWLTPMLLCFSQKPLFAVLITYEPFDYPNGELLVGKTNGFGFISAWEPAGFNARTPELFEMRPGPLNFQNLAATGTNHLSADGVPQLYPGIAGLGRMVATNFGITGTRLYLS